MNKSANRHFFTPFPGQACARKNGGWFSFLIFLFLFSSRKKERELTNLKTYSICNDIF